MIPRTKTESTAHITSEHDDLSETDTQSEEANSALLASPQKRKVRVCTAQTVNGHRINSFTSLAAAGPTPLLFKAPLLVSPWHHM